MQGKKRSVEELERQLELMQEECAAAQRAKSLFLCNMSHEVRTPLNGILGMLGLLCATKLEPEQQLLVESLDKSANSLLHLVSDILDYSKLEAGNLLLEEAATDPRCMLESIIVLVSDQAKEKGLNLDLSVAQNIPNKVILDQNRTVQVLLNLLNNAIKFSEVGEVKVSLTMETLDSGEPALSFRVTDNGPGIPREQTGRIFDLFYQVENKVNANGGKGLGLALCKGLVELMKGSIEVDSELGRGSRFCVSIPLIVAMSDPSTCESEHLNSANSGLSILVVEDNEINQLYAATVLEKGGHFVTIAPDGLEGVRAARKLKPDLILMDLQMPVMDGWEATRQIRAQESSETPVPIVALTAKATTEDRRLCRDAGMDGYLTKPIREEALLRAVRDYTCRKPSPATERPPCLEWLKERVGTSEDFVMLCRLFSRSYPTHLETLHSAIERTRAGELLQATRALKGIFLDFEFTEGVEAARDFERLARQHQWERARLLAPLMKRLCRKLESQLSMAAPPQALWTEPAGRPAASDHPVTVLVVDDEDTNRLLGRRLLERQGYSVLEAKDGLEAIQQLDEKLVDLVLMDVVMPNLSGVEACRQIKQNIRTRQIPVVLVTSLEDENERLAGIDAGADDCLTKPLRGRESLLRIRNAIRLSQAHQQLEESFEKTRRLKQSYQRLPSSLAAGLSGPVKSILNFSQLLSAESRPNSSTQIYSKQVQISTKILEQMLKTLQDVDSWANSRVSLQADWHDLGSIVETEVLFFAELPEANILLQNQATCSVFCDSKLLRRVIANLVGGALTEAVGVDFIEVTVMEEDQSVRVSVSSPCTDKLQPDLQQLSDQFCRLVLEAHNGSFEYTRNNKGQEASFVLPKLPSEVNRSAKRPITSIE